MNKREERKKSRRAFIKKFRRMLIISVPVYLCCLIIGMACIFVIQKRSHVSLRDNVERAAASIINGEDYEDTYTSRNMIMYLYEDGEITLLSSKQARRNYEACIERYSSYSLDGETHYTIVAAFPSLSFAAMASTPVSDTQTLYMFQSIRALRPTLIIYLVIVTIVFAIVLAYSFVLFRKNEKVNEIYRCYVANVSHELKSPVASIRALTETLSEGMVKDEEIKSRYYGMIISESRNLERSIQSIMELSKIQEHREDFSCVQITPEHLFGGICRRYEELCAEMDICFEADSTLFALPALYTNRDRVCQVLDILISNSIKFMDDEREGKIIISAKLNGRRAQICVSDNGTGIDEADLEHIFERFFKSNLSRNKSGSGLGLAIAREIVQQLGGEIHAESSAGEGASFYFSIKTAKGAPGRKGEIKPNERRQLAGT